MELRHIVDRVGACLQIVDGKTTTQRASRTGSGKYIPCVGTIWEEDATREILAEWDKSFPDLLGYKPDWTEVPFPTRKGACDFVLCTTGFSSSFGEPPYEWAIENKYVRFIGDNGKNNDYGVTKVVSPYRKDRSSVRDAERLSDFTTATRKAVMMYGFEFDAHSKVLSATWLKNNMTRGDHEKNVARVRNMMKVLDNTDPVNNEMSMMDLVPLFEAACETRGIRLGPLATTTFSGLDRHPLYHKGRILAWEIL
jgi:hypothetical protein